MSDVEWSQDTSETIQAFQAKGEGRGEASALVQWSTWCVESLFYLSHLDSNRESTAKEVNVDLQAIELAHARWAAGTAITALDLCAAALGRIFGNDETNHERDIRDFDPNGGRKKSIVNANRDLLDFCSRAWIDSVVQNPDYRLILSLRHPFTHARLIRHFSLGSGGPSTQLSVPEREVSDSDRIPVEELIRKCRSLAFGHVDEFLEVLGKI